MKPKSTRVRVLGGVLLAALSGSGTLQADNNNPSIEACAGYAEADAAYEAAMQQADAVYDAAKQQADAVYDAAIGSSSIYDTTIDRRPAQAAYKAAIDRRLAANKAAVQQAKQAWATAYYASYDRDGGPRSDVHAVMVKFVEHHRQRCSELHGL